MSLFTARKLVGPIGGIAIQALGLGFGLLSNILLARLLGPAGFGIYGFAYNIVALIAIPLHTGLALLLVKEIAGFRTRQDHSRIRGIVSAANRAVIALSILAAAGILGWAMFERQGSASPYLQTLIVAVLLLPPMALGSIRGGILRGLDSPIMGQLPDSIIRPAILVLALAIAGLLGQSISPSVAMGLHVAAALTGMTFGAIIIRRVMPPSVWSAAPIHEWRLWRNALMPLSAVAGIQALSASLATIVLAAHRPPAEIAYFRVAELGASVVAMPLSAIAIYASGRIAELFAIGGKASLQLELKHFARIAFFSACALSLPIAFSGGALLRLMFGREYEVALTPLLILCIAQIANTSAGIVGIAMTMAGQYRETVIALIVALALQVVLTLILVPRFGAIGAALGSATGVICWSQILFWRVRYLLSVSTFIV